MFSRTALILLASGRSRRFRRGDKMLADLGGKPLIQRTADILRPIPALAKIVVCPNNRRQVTEGLESDFIVTPNPNAKNGLGSSIAAGVNVSMQFQPEAVLICLADMPFVERGTLAALRQSMTDHPGTDIVHCGIEDKARPPAIFSARCFEEMLALRGETGANAIITSNRFQVGSISTPRPELLDIDTRSDLSLAREQLKIRMRHIN